MNTDLSMLNKIREETISRHYRAAYTELKEKIQEEPLKSNFSIYSGCISSDITTEIAKRFNNGNIKAIVCKNGILRICYYLDVTVKLPGELSQYEKNELQESEDSKEQ